MFGEHMMKLNVKNILHFLNNDSHVDKRGYLHKKGEVNKGWQRRWFLLKGNMLFYYHTPHDSEPIGLIVLEGCSINSCSTDTTTFSIAFQCDNSRTYYLCADDEESCSAWINSLQRSSYGYLRAQVDRMYEQVLALENKKDIVIDHMVMRSEKESLSQARATSLCEEPGGSSSRKSKPGHRAFSSPLTLRKKGTSNPTMDIKNTRSPGKHRKNKEGNGSNNIAQKCRTFEQMHQDFAPGKPVITNNQNSTKYTNIINNVSSNK